MSFSYSPKISTNGLVLYLDAANRASYTSGSITWNDLSRGFNNGTLINEPTFNSANNGSIVFNGVNNYVEVTNSNNLNITGSSITVSVWVKFNNTGNYKTIFVKDAPSSNSTGYQIYISNTEKSRWGISTTSGFNFMFGSTLSTNTWYNIVGTYDGTTNYLYENGVLINSQSCTGTIINSSAYNIRMGIYRGSESLNGNIAMAQVYNTFSTPQTVLQNYNATKTRFGL